MKPISIIILILAFLSLAIYWIVIFYTKSVLRREGLKVPFLFTSNFKHLKQLRDFSKKNNQYKNLYIISLISTVLSVLLVFLFIATMVYFETRIN